MFVSGVAMLSSSARTVVVVRCGTARRGAGRLRSGCSLASRGPLARKVEGCKVRGEAVAGYQFAVWMIVVARKGQLRRQLRVKR